MADLGDLPGTQFGLAQYLATKRAFQDQGERDQFLQQKEALGPDATTEQYGNLGLRFSDPRTMAQVGESSADRKAAIAQRADAVNQLYNFKIQNMDQQMEATLRRIQNEEHRTELRNAIDQQKNELTKQRNDIMLQLGLTRAEIDRLKAQNVPEKTSQQDNAAYNAGLREITKDDANAQSVVAIENAIKRWQELQPQVQTGRVTGAVNPGILQPQFQELKQLENFLAVNNFKPGQGQISNYERALIKGAGPSTSNDEETNMRITQVMLGAAQNAKDRLAFRQWYLDKNKKLLGADKEWNDYIDENPRFVKGPGGSIVPNQTRPDWMTYFSAGGKSKGQGWTPDKEERYQELLRKRGGS